MYAPIVRKRVQLELLRSLRGKIDVAAGDARTSSPDDARVTNGNWEHLLVQNIHAVVRGGTANADRRAGNVQLESIGDRDL